VTRRTFLAAGIAASGAAALRSAPSRTDLTIRGEDFLLNGQPTYPGRSWNGLRIEGLLLNVRAVQATFDDANAATSRRWAYSDSGAWDPERNTREFIAALPEWRRAGILSFTLNLQGGSPEGYSTTQPWDNTAIDAKGDLKPAYMARIAAILDRADELGMAPILGCYYFGQDQRVKDEASIKRGVVSTVEWLLGRESRNVILEIANECDVREYDHEILKPPRIHELIELAKSRSRNGRRILAGTSFGGGVVPTGNVIRASDFLLLHGNGPDDPRRITRMIARARASSDYRPMPLLINEDDHFRFEARDNHLRAALAAHCSWGFFDPDGFQSPPVNWSANTARKQAFFATVKEVTGS
jgi:hypothetical protein